MIMIILDMQIKKLATQENLKVVDEEQFTFKKRFEKG
jgi:hypothetical protein